MPARRKPSQSEEPEIVRHKEPPRWLWPAVFSAALVISVCLSISFLGLPSGETAEVKPEATSLPYDREQPFTLSDLTAAQLSQLRSSATRQMTVSDGPRGISVGDSLDKLLNAYPNNYSGAQLSLNTSSSGTLLASEQILYCDSVFENANGIRTALPPRGILSDDGGRNLVVTLMAPTSPYPAGTADNYRKFEHIFIKYTIDPDTMCVSSIVLGLTD